MVNDRSFVPSLARKHLLGGNTRQILGEEAICLYKAIKQIADVTSVWAMADPRSDKGTRDIMGQAELRLEAAKQRLAVIAATNVVLCLRGTEREEEAGKMLARKRGALPAALVHQLEAAAKGQPMAVAPSAPKRRKEQEPEAAS